MLTPMNYFRIAVWDRYFFYAIMFSLIDYMLSRGKMLHTGSKVEKNVWLMPYERDVSHEIMYW